MDLELATTYDMLNELSRRKMHFVFAGIQNTNRKETEICYACQGHSRGEMLRLIRRLHRRVRLENDFGATG